MSVSAPDRLSPLAGVFAPGHHGASGAGRVVIRHVRSSIVEVMAPRQHEARLNGMIEQALGIGAPKPGKAVMHGTLSAIWLRPACFMIVGELDKGGDLMKELSPGATGPAVLVEQTHGKTVLRLAGANARAVMAKGCRLDLHPRVFRTGDSASTRIGHINCTFLQRDEIPTYDIIVPSTLARAFVDWILPASEEFGAELNV
jgi:sarcosine oxidase subunit gamma